MVQKSTSNDLPVGGISVPSGPFIGPFIEPVKRAIEHVQSPDAKKVLYGRFPTWLSGNVLNIWMASARWSCPPRVGS
jgi:hypothetical protein